MKSLCREFARMKGRGNVTVDELVNVISSLQKEELLSLIQSKQKCCSKFAHFLHDRINHYLMWKQLVKEPIDDTHAHCAPSESSKHYLDRQQIEEFDGE